MNRETYYRNARLARIGALGTLAMSLSYRWYQWFLVEVYDLRFPHIGDGRQLPESFDSLIAKSRERRRLGLESGRLRMGRWTR